MTTRIPKKFLITFVTLISVILLIHGINKEYFHASTGVLDNEKSSLVNVAALWRGERKQNVDQQGDDNSLSNFTAYYNDGVNTTIQGDAEKKSTLSIISHTTVNTMKTEVKNADIRTESVNTKLCTRRNNIAFFKMHKCSSSTVQNILMRYGDRYDLNFVLPPSGNYLGTTLFNKRFVQSFPVKEYNILTHHTRFSKEGFDSVMPSNTIFATIIRDPVTMYESTFTYLNYPSRYRLPAGKALETFLQDPNSYYLSHTGKDHAKDSMLFDLGLDNDLKSDDSAMAKKIQQIASDFDLVMMTEYFPESLILLKELMCWDFEDITYFKMNARSKSSVRSISTDIASKIRKWNSGDSMLYDHFNRTFWEKVRAFGEERMRDEVAKLNKINDLMKEKCIEGVIVNDKKVWHPSGISVESFRLKDSAAHNKDCQLMAKTELPFTGYIRQKQLAKYFGHKAPVL